MIVNQGDIYWVHLEDVDARSPAVTHPHVVIQENVLNHADLSTVAMCPLTSNRKRVTIPGNVLLEAGEAGLRRQSVVEVSKVHTVEKTRLGEYVGTLDERRIAQILAGIRFLERSFGW